MSICHYAMRILCMIWNTADPQTTKMKRPNNQGPTAYFSSAGFSDFGTLPLVVIFLLCFSLANLILCLAAISVRMRLPTFKNLYNFLLKDMTLYILCVGNKQKINIPATRGNVNLTSVQGYSRSFINIARVQHVTQATKVI